MFTRSCRCLSWSKRAYYHRVFLRSCHNNVEPEQNAVATETDYDTNPALPHVDKPETKLSGRIIDVGRNVGRNQDDYYKRFLMSPDQPRDARCIKVAIVGAPNAGKSTLVNSLLGWKVNAVSCRAHTTRKNTTGMLTEDNTQIVFVDTPGALSLVAKKKHGCDSRMMTDPEESLHEADMVGVLVDVSDHYTRCNLHTEVKKMLHLNPDIPSFLILNKVDLMQNKGLLLYITERLTNGFVANLPIKAKSKLIGRKKEEKMDTRFFDKLESKYGKLGTVKFPDLREKFIEEDLDEISKKEDYFFDKSADVTESETKLAEDSYQSSYLKDIQSKINPDIVLEQKRRKKREEDTDWLEKMDKIKDAVKAPDYWDKFDRVFFVSSLTGDGLQEIKDYLLLSAPTQDWTYHSTLVTDQTPEDLAKMLVWQCILEHIRSRVAYECQLEVGYWGIDDNNRLNIVMNIYVKNTYELSLLVGKGGDIMRKINHMARQVLLDAFQCEIRLKLVVQKGKPARG